jgi:CRP/FNR family cyclic AMP-dependent transcriptional regulator
MAESNQLKKLFLSANTRRKYTKGSIILMQNSNTDEAYLIEKGIVGVIDFDQNGEQRSITILSQDHIFPLSWLLTSIPDSGSLYYYKALTDVELYLNNIDTVRDFVRNNALLSWRFVDILAKSYVNAVSRIQNLQKTNVEEKIDFIIYYLAILLGKSIGENKYEIDGIFTHQEIADLAGLTRESVSRQLKKTKYKKIIIKSNGKILLDLSQLDIDAMPVVFPVVTNIAS